MKYRNTPDNNSKCLSTHVVVRIVVIVYLFFYSNNSKKVREGLQTRKKNICRNKYLSFIRDQAKIPFMICNIVHININIYK